MLLLVIAVLMIAMRSAKPTPAVDQSTRSVEKSASPENVTFYLAGMNTKLKIL